MKKQLKRWLGVLGIASITPVVAENLVEDYNPELDGQWRGKLEFQQGVSLVLGINIDEGKVTGDSPNQGMFGREPTTFTLSGNRVSFEDKELEARFEGTLEGDVLKGRFTQGKTIDIALKKLDASDRERMKFEASYHGDLVIDKTAALPLKLNVAVLPDGYLGTLDSPAQHSYGIPLTELVINDQKISFQSPIINASYSGTYKNGVYEGTFVQGMERPLALKKADPGEEDQVSVPKPQAGNYGGALAVITRDKVETQFYADHDAQTLYEIGSNTKTMVAYLLASAIGEGKVPANAALTDYWAEAPENVTLVELASHHSGLPRLPENLALDEGSFHDPYAHYDLREMQAALANVTPGEKAYLYSNFGFGVLAETLAKAADTPFPALLEKELFNPIGMESTSVALTNKQDSPLLAQGHDARGQPVNAWHFDAMAGAGAVVSNLEDMARYIQAMMEQSAAKDPAVELMLNPENTLGKCCRQPLGWMLDKDEKGHPFAWHAGQTAGFTSVIGFYLDGSRGMVLLNNQSIGVEEQMLHWLTQAK